MSNNYLAKAIELKRRTRDPLAIDLCDAIIQNELVPKTQLGYAAPLPEPAPTQVMKSSFDKTTYMRNYMRNKRQAEKANASRTA